MKKKLFGSFGILLLLALMSFFLASKLARLAPAPPPQCATIPDGRPGCL